MEEKLLARYGSGHKEVTRGAIVRAAGRAFRARGIAGVSVNELMAGAGLTRGGFYAHFGSKDQLTAEACSLALTEAAERRFGAATPSRSSRTPAAYIRAYLSRAHRDRPETGCAIAALAAEVARESPRTRHAFTEAVGTYVRELESLLPPEAGEDTAWALLAGMAGTVALARAVDDSQLSDRILSAGRQFYTQALCRDTPNGDAGTGA